MNVIVSKTKNMLHNFCFRQTCFFAVCVFSVFLFLNANFAKAALDGSKNFSINETAHTLQTDQFEIGLAGVSWGINDNFMLMVPTAPMAFQNYGADLRGKLEIGKYIRLAPQAGLADVDGCALLCPRGRMALGFDLFSGKHSVTLAVESSRQIRYDYRVFGLNSAPSWGPSYNFNYDFYTKKGNLLYFGLYNFLPYYGFTCAFKNFHAGVGGLFYVPFGYLALRI